MDISWLPERGWARRAMLGALVLYAWTVFGILSSAHFFLGEEASTGNASLTDVAGHILLFYWAWAAVTPLVLLALRRAVRAGVSTFARTGILVIATPAIVLVHGILYLTAVHLAGFTDASPIGGAQLVDYAMRHAGGDIVTVVLLVAGYVFVDARQQAHSRELAAAALEARLATAELEVLRSRLQPHFLFNALNTVQTLVLRGDGAGAEEAISRISRYLRAALAQRVQDSVTVHDEMLGIEQYFAIEQLRFGDALRLETSVTREAATVRIPAMIVQPIVENAIHHGIGGASHDALIEIRASTVGERLRVLVTDPGKGESAPASAANGNGDGFGLRYVRERLRHRYGDRATVSLEACDAGTRVTVELPIADEHDTSA